MDIFVLLKLYECSYHFSFFSHFFPSAGSVVHINSVPTQRWNMCISATIVPRKFEALLLCINTCQSVCVLHSLCRVNSDIEIIRRIKTTRNCTVNINRMGLFFSLLHSQKPINKELNQKSFKREEFMRKVCTKTLNRNKC